MDWPLVLAQSLWLIFPAYVSNAFAVLIGGGTPMDLGRSMRDGNRIFGDGKTLRGFIGGASFGVCIGLVLNYLLTFSESEFLPLFSPVALLALSFGALLGDLTESFIKRRIGVARGRSLPVLDQLDFVAGAFLCLLVFNYHWLVEAGFTIAHAIIILLVTPILHIFMNFVGYKLKKKKVPW